MHVKTHFKHCKHFVSQRSDFEENNLLIYCSSTNVADTLASWYIENLYFIKINTPGSKQTENNKLIKLTINIQQHDDDETRDQISNMHNK